MGEEAEKDIVAIKQRTDALGKEILQMENQGAALIKKEIALEDRLVAVFGQMLEAEKGKIADAKRSGATKEAALMGRIAYLQNKQREFEERKEMLRHLKDKSLAIREEMGNAERKVREEIAELYRIKEIKKKHAVEQKKKQAAEKAAQRAAKEAAEKAAQRAAEAVAEKAAKKARAALKPKKAVPAKKPAAKAKSKVKAVKKAVKKKAVKAAKPKRSAAVKKVVVKKPVKIKKPKARVPKVKLKKRPAFIEELPEEEEEEEMEEEEAEAAEEGAVEEEAPAEEEVPAEEEAVEEEVPVEEEAAPEDEVPAAEEEVPVEEAVPVEEEQPSALLERVLEKAKKEKVVEEEAAKEPADYGFTEFSSVDISLSHPDWPEKSSAPSNALLSRETGNFSFDLLQIPAQGRSVDDVVAQATARIESNPGGKVLERKKTGDKAFIVYSESIVGREFLNKAVFILHEDKIFKLIFSAPTEQFDKINDLFWKSAKSISFK